MKHPISLAFAALSLLTAHATTATAGEYWSNDWWYVDDSSSDDGPTCGLTTKDEGTGGRSSVYTHILLNGNTDGVFVAVNNADWTITKDREYENLDITFFDANGKMSAEYSGANWVGFGRDGLMSNNNKDILEYFTKSHHATIFRNDGTEDEPEFTVIARVDLTGSAQAVSKLQECFARAQTRHNANVARERTNPRNPFG